MIDNNAFGFKNCNFGITTGFKNKLIFINFVK